jgi:hypothetical protein
MVPELGSGIVEASHELSLFGAGSQPRLSLASLIVTVGLALATVHAQTYVTPRLGGGQVAADMVHIDIYYDADANQLHTHVDDTYGLPHLRPLEAGLVFDPQVAFAVLTGKAYNAQYGWNAGGFFSIPAGAAIWIEQLDRSPGLEVYDGWGRTGSYAPLFGTAGSPHLWQWSGVMVHNTYAVMDPFTNRFFAEYHIYFGDATTGSREGFLDLDDAQVRLEWTVDPVEEPFQFGVVGSASNAPLSFLNADHFVTQGEWVLTLASTNAGSPLRRFERAIPMLALPATVANGGPSDDHASLGACVEVQLVSLAGPSGGRLSVWEAEGTEPLCIVGTGESAGTNRFPVSQNQAVAGTDPFGRVPGRRFAVDQPGLYTLGFRLVDTSMNGPGGNPLHGGSDAFTVYLQAGVAAAWAERQGQSFTVTFGGEAGRVFHLERRLALDATASWQRVAGPLVGTNRLQRLTDPTATSREAFYCLRHEAK